MFFVGFLVSLNALFGCDEPWKSNRLLKSVPNFVNITSKVSTKKGIFKRKMDLKKHVGLFPKYFLEGDVSISTPEV